MDGQIDEITTCNVTPVAYSDEPTDNHYLFPQLHDALAIVLVSGPKYETKGCWLDWGMSN